MYVVLAYLILFQGLFQTADAYLKMPIGYQEGTMRSVDCEGGYATGLEAWFRHADGVRGRVMMAIRLKCSSGKIKVEYEGSKGDDRVLGEGDGEKKSAMCPEGTGITAFDWRLAAPSDPSNKAAPRRAGGIRVYCGSESSATPLVLDAEPADKKYEQSPSKCSMLDELKGKEGKVTGLVVWYEHDVTGFHLASCQPAS